MTQGGVQEQIDPALHERLSKMSPAKRALFLKASGFSPETAQQILASTTGTGIPRRDRAAPVPMSFAQELLWRLERASPSHIYNVPRSTRLRGPLDVAALQRALDVLAARHEILRTTFDLVDDEPRQIVHAAAPVPIDVVDLRSAPAGEREPEARRVVRERSMRPFDLSNDSQLRVSLIRLADDDHVLLIESHHVASDVISRGIVFNELRALYNEARGAAPAALPPLPAQYGDFAIWQRQALTGPRLEKLLTYWRERLGGLQPLELPTDHRGAATPAGSLVVRDLSPAFADAVRTLSATHGATVFMTLLAGVNGVLARYTGQTDIAVGSPISGRPHADVEGLVGYFVNTLVLRTSLEGDPSFSELLQRVRATSLGAFEHQEIPYELMLTALSESGRVGSAPLFNVMLSMLDGGEGGRGGLALDGLEAAAFGANRGAAKFDLIFGFREGAQGLRMTVEYRRDLFEPDTIERLVGHFETLVIAGATTPNTPVARLPMLTPAEETQCLTTWNDTEAGWPTNATLHQLFERQVAERPGAVALTCDGVSWTYRDLDGRANRLAWRLREKNVAPDTLVAVCMDKSADLVAALLGILKAGGAYVPMDPAYPDDRLTFMLGDCGAAIVVTDAALVPRLSMLASAEPLVATEAWADGPHARDDAPPPSAAPTNLCYVIYTSGSTGRPKGVLIEHRNVVRLLFNDHLQFEFSDKDVWTVFHSFSFDFSVWEMYGALLYGGRLVVVPRPVAQDPAAYIGLLAKEHVTVLNQVPSAFYGLMQEELSRPTATLGALRYIVFGGEALQPALLHDFHARYPGATLVNMFGITETTVHVTFKAIGDAEIANGASNIGGPIPTLTLYVLDDHQQLVPIGVTGELCVGGAGVARGYLNRPDLTEERFIAHPFRAGERLYRSGDLGRLRPSGEIEYLGRRDAQVKIRGFRIELGEIESAICAHPSVRSAAVIAVAARDGTQLAGYFVAATEATGAPVTPASLRTYLRERLPDYMVPSFLTPIDAIPITSNGKLDRAKLPAPQAAVAETASTRAAPRTTQEHQILQIWKKLLDAPRIGIRDNFFDLGGHSLLAVRMLYEIEQMSGKRIPLAALFEDATIHHLAALLESEVHGEDEPPVVILPGHAGARPFAFLHGDVHGGGWYCRRLARLVGPEVTLIVLPTLRPESDADASTIEAMAARHVTELRKVQPKGPYRLGGFCFGGVIAFEMAQQLHAAGEQVEQLIVVDSGIRNALMVPWRATIDRVLPPGPGIDRLKRRVLWVRRIMKVKRLRPTQRVHLLFLAAKRAVARVAGRRAAPPPAIETTSDVWTRPGGRVILFEARASGAYIPRPYPGAIDLLVAAQKDEGQIVDARVSLGDVGVKAGRGWQLLSPRVRAQAIEANHVGLITNQLEVLAARIRECLVPSRPGA
jgi:amino acid adenylation domain-containing protein